MTRLLSSAIITTASILLYICLNTSPLTANTPESGKKLATELGCNNCHTSLGQENTLRTVIPALDNAGLRYQTGWLFKYLQDPAQIRRHIGKARMPDFHLREDEALALALFLSTQTTRRDDWLPLPEPLRNAMLPSSDLDREAFIDGPVKQHACLACHKAGDAGAEIGPLLLDIGYRLKPAAIIEIMVDPSRYGIPAATMSSLFFEKGAKEYKAYFAGAPEAIREVAANLMKHARKKRQQQEAALEKARKQFPDISAETGRAVFKALNCSACHGHTAIRPAENPAPDLSYSGLRLKQNWLRTYLSRPHAIRRYGYLPGDGSRMPDFRLTEAEAADLAAWLSSLKDNANLAQHQAKPGKPTLFASKKASTLLSEKLACLGCHQLDGSGGQIGPALDNTGQRLEAAYIDLIIDQPEKLLPHRSMPRQLMPAGMRQLLVNFLGTRIAGIKQEYPNLTDFLPIDKKPDEPAAILYQQQCGACHGGDGDGQGFNAQYLPAQPTVHNDAAAMAQRPDDTLYDGIFAGGYILNRSQTMPAWGETLSDREIRQLVDHIRALCDCEQPGWANEK